MDYRGKEPPTSQFESITFESIIIANINQNKPKTRKDAVFATVGIHLNAKPQSQIKANGIITKIKEGEPTRWVNSLVYRRKQNERLTLCLDPKGLNAAIQRERHVTPTLEKFYRNYAKQSSSPLSAQNFGKVCITLRGVVFVRNVTVFLLLIRELKQTTFLTTRTLTGNKLGTLLNVCNTK